MLILQAFGRAPALGDMELFEVANWSLGEERDRPLRELAHEMAR